jgi:hypothetical protein
MTPKEKRNLLIAAVSVFVALWVAIVAFGDVLGVSPEAKEAIQTAANGIGVLASTYVMRKVAGIKDTDGDGVPDDLDSD